MGDPRRIFEPEKSGRRKRRNETRVNPLKTNDSAKSLIQPLNDLHDLWPPPRNNSFRFAKRILSFSWFSALSTQQTKRAVGAMRTIPSG
jgi:hypothetical protein